MFPEQADWKPVSLGPVLPNVASEDVSLSEGEHGAIALKKVS
jgi:hypothetical protein